MLLISDRQLTNTAIYGTVPANTPFECPQDTAIQLINNGLARRYEPPQARYEIKVSGPTEVGPTQPFRDVLVPDEKPAEVSAAGNKELPQPKVSLPEKRIVDRSRRGGRPKGRARGKKS